jgi:hypothetical protein
VDEAALRHGAGVEVETSDPDEAYARFPEPGRRDTATAGSRGSWPRQEGRGQPTRYSGLLAAATRQEAPAAIACVTRMHSLRAEEIPHFLGDLPPALNVCGSPPRRRLSIILPREGAD